MQKVHKIDQDFLQAYIREHNAGRPIVDIMVEYEGYMFAAPGEHFDVNLEERFKLKLKPDNTISIFKAKEQIFTREDMIEAFVEGGLYSNDRIGRAWHKLGAKEWLDKYYPNK